MLNEAIKMAKGSDEEKAMTSVSMPKSLKEDLVSLANGNNVSTNALIVSILTLSINSNDVVSTSIGGKSLVEELERLEKKRAQIGRFIEDNHGLDPSVESEAIILDELKSVVMTIETLKGVLS